MNTTQITHFVSLVEHGSYSTAANALGISQPALTKSIAKLEEALGVTLLDRARGKSAKLTVFGREVYDRGAKILEEIVETRSSIQMMKKGYSGVVRIGFGMSLPPSTTAQIACLIQQKMPETVVHIRTGPQHLLTPRLRQNELDMLVGASHSVFQNNDLTTNKLWDDPFGVFIGADHELASEVMYNREWAQKYDWISSSRLIAADNSANTFLGHTARSVRTSNFDVFDPSVIGQILATSSFLSAWPSRSFRDLVARGVLKMLPIPAIEGQVWSSSSHLIHITGRQTSTAVQAAQRIILSQDWR